VPSRKLPGRALKDETVVVDTRARKVFVMNPVGGVVWAGVERGASVDEIVDDVVARFRVDRPRASADVMQFLDQLEAAGLAAPAADDEVG
jgi:hypothetical protein